MNMNSVKPINILFRNDDPCALSDPAHERRYLEIFAKYNIPQVVSVIPFMSEDIHNYRQTHFHKLSENQAMIDLLKEYMSKGLIDVVQHGTTHQTNHLHPGREPVSADYHVQGLGNKWMPYGPIYPEKGYSEFNGLDKKFVKKELSRGKEYLEETLGTKIKAFTFPWGRLDLNTLEALRDADYSIALCGAQPKFQVKDLISLYNAREDVFTFAKELNGSLPQTPVLYHVVLHSWMLKDDDLSKLDNLLGALAKDGRIGFVTTQDLMKIKQIKWLSETDHRSRLWSQAANRHMGTPVKLAQRYHLSLRPYWKKMLKSGLFGLVYERIGINRFWAITAMLTLACVWLGWLKEGLVGNVIWMAAFGFGGLFCGMTLLKWKNRNAEKSKGSPQMAKTDDFKILADKVVECHNSRNIVNKYFEAYSGVNNHSENESKKYWQLQYRYSANPWYALNKLADIYNNRNYIFLALICLVESLRLNSKQDKIFERAQALSKEYKFKFPEQLMEDDVTVSVIMPTNRDSCEIEEAIQSVLNQTFQDFELIVINDGGPQEIREIIESFHSDKIRYCRIDQPNGGDSGAARNKGIHLARGKYLAYLDDDDIYYPHHLETMVNLLKDGKYKCGYANMSKVRGFVDQGRFKAEKMGGVWDVPFNKETMVTRAIMGTNTILHEKKILNETGLFNENLKPGEDEDLWIRCAARYDFKHISRCTSEWRRKENTSCSKNLLDCVFNGMLYRKYYAFFRGKVAFIKYFLVQNNHEEAYRVYKEIKDQYQCCFKADFVLQELKYITKHFNDKPFLNQIDGDYRQLHRKNSDIGKDTK